MHRSVSERLDFAYICSHIDAIPASILLINEEICDKLWESALADPFQFTIYSRQKASLSRLSRYGAREDPSYYKAMYIC